VEATMTPTQHQKLHLVRLLITRNVQQAILVKVLSKKISQA